MLVFWFCCTITCIPTGQLRARKSVSSDRNLFVVFQLAFLLSGLRYGYNCCKNVKAFMEPASFKVVIFPPAAVMNSNTWAVVLPSSVPCTATFPTLYADSVVENGVYDHLRL